MRVDVREYEKWGPLRARDYKFWVGPIKKKHILRPFG